MMSSCSGKNLFAPIRPIVGKPAKDAIFVAGFSKHLKNSNKYNESHDLIGGQYKGLYFMTFNNSKHRRNYSFGFAQEWYRKEFKTDIALALGYKAGFINAYRNKLPNIDNWSLGILPIASLEYKRVGIDCTILPFDKGAIVLTGKILL